METCAQQRWDSSARRSKRRLANQRARISKADLPGYAKEQQGRYH